MKFIISLLMIVLVPHVALAASAMAKLYLQSAAAWERCTGNALTLEQASHLSKLISQRTPETYTPADVLTAVEKARASIHPSCEPLLVQVDRDYFQNFVLPRIGNSAQGPTSPPAPTASNVDSVGR